MQLVRALNYNALLFQKNIYVTVYFALYRYRIIVRKSGSNKHYPV